MADFPSVGVMQAGVEYSSHGGASMLQGCTASFSGAVWVLASKAIFQPVVVERPFVVRAMAISVTTQSGNVDVGVYTEKGARIVSKGTTAVAAAGLQTFDMTASVTGTASPELPPAVYFLAMACDNVTAAFTRTTAIAGTAAACGVVEMASAFVLPATATFAVQATGYQPMISMLSNATV